MFGKQHSKEYADGYRDGFHDGADCKQNFKLHMLGYEVGELLKIIQEHENKEEKELSTKITEAGKFGIREETVLKVIDSIALAGYKIVPK